MNKVIAEMKDDKGRPLVILMRTSRGTISHVFKRYATMTDVDKARVITMYRRICSSPAWEQVDGPKSEQEMRDFLEFKEQTPCG